MDPPNLPLLLLLTLASTIDAQDLFPKPYCNSTDNLTADSTYQNTLTTLLSSISTTNSCGSAIEIRRVCPDKKGAVLFRENCTIQYSSTSIFRTVKTDPDYALFYFQDFTSPETYNAALQTLLGRLRGEAAGGGSLRKYATGNTSVGFNTIYAMTQCTLDLTNQQCIDCLMTVIGRLGQCCAGKMGVRIMAPSCQFQYETNNRFFDLVVEPLPPPPAPVADALPPPPGTFALV
ncbi:hypothetical protein EUGRSUZ_E03047 [Eucalyptus grandis]|uniref:Uncharacterized protein n=2 Tax=Eucalyptus grandis TaxID=71139 RepID=A0ACC3L0D0_EUCGR|nr:hypothetical protein EUGRSUZ_E03047 [Eucalyptus grandis]